ncbi:uncharacterized protein FIBRA_00803 [Fibroporia radiculosa]|uniref:N-acetyltransferase domain-containing protein n=1 Tax=Fibroporia radiculosa TaxID=599839 RepID=J4G0M0_9APHY|nr:uncharacterized protein FIBRA_00803 [Fibroporia radiculosa]CCL98798.1 predicted protein [Fibroporia radiculosa]
MSSPYSVHERPTASDVRSSPGAPTVKPMGYAHIFTSVRTENAAFENDPLLRYVRNAPDARFGDIYRAVAFVAQLVLDVHREEALTIGNGDAFVTYLLKEDPFYGVVFPLLKKLDVFSSPEQHRRRTEWFEKRQVAFKEAFGENLDDMIYLMELATSPQKQGLGYGSKLIQAVTDLADATERRVWLTSSNVANTTFYEHAGFVTLAEFTVGDSNPTWTESPIRVQIMSREPRRPDGLIVSTDMSNLIRRRVPSQR